MPKRIHVPQNSNRIRWKKATWAGLLSKSKNNWSKSFKFSIFENWKRLLQQQIATSFGTNTILIEPAMPGSWMIRTVFQES